jgi:hypothetical protein
LFSRSALPGEGASQKNWESIFAIVGVLTNNSTPTAFLLAGENTQQGPREYSFWIGTNRWPKSSTIKTAYI